MDTKNIIANALEHLMLSHTFKKITTQMIIDEAHVSRSTFYRHFKDKYDLVNWKYKTFIDNLMKDSCYEDMTDCTIDIYSYLYENRIFFSKTINVEDTNSFWNFLYDFVYDFNTRKYLQSTKQTELSEEDRIAFEYFSIGSIHITKNWLLGGATISPEKMAQFSSELKPEKYKQHLSSL